MRGGEVRACAWVRAAWVSAPSTFTIARVSPTRCCTGAVLATRAAVASGWVVAAFAAPSIGTITRVSPTRCCARGPILARATVASGGLVTRSTTPSIGTTTRVIATVRRAGGTVLARAAVASVRWRRRRRRRRRVKLSAGFRRESDQQAHLQEQEHPAADNWRCTRPESPPGASRGGSVARRIRRIGARARSAVRTDTVCVQKAESQKAESRNPVPVQLGFLEIAESCAGRK